MIGIEDDSLRWFAAERAEAEPDVTALVAAYSGVLYRVAFSVLRNTAEAEDVVQDTFVRVLEKRLSLGEVREFRPWLVRITWNLALDRKRRVPVEQIDALFAEGLVAKDVAADVALDDVQQITRVLREMDALPKGERYVLLLSAVEELGTAEIGAVLGKSESALRALLFRARTRLKERLAKGGLSRRVYEWCAAAREGGAVRYCGGPVADRRAGSGGAAHGARRDFVSECGEAVDAGISRCASEYEASGY